MGFLDSVSSTLNAAAKQAGKAWNKLAEEAAKAPPAPPRKEPSFGEKVELFATSSFETAKDYGKAIGHAVREAPGDVADSVRAAKAAVVAKVEALDAASPPPRGLSEPEVAMLKNVYGDSVDYTKVEIIENEDLATRHVSGGCPFTLGNTIRIPPGRMPLTDDLLTHEMLHVWQYQNGGPGYLPSAIWAQKVGDGYDFEKGIREGKAWAELNPEQQAEFFEKASLAKALTGPDLPFVYENEDTGTTADYTEYLRTALAEIRAGRGAGALKVNGGLGTAPPFFD